jgi:hypothetical protein
MMTAPISNEQGTMHSEQGQSGNTLVSPKKHNPKIFFGNTYNDDLEYLFKDDKLIINFPGGVSAVFNVTIDDKTMILEVYSRIGITPFWIHNYSFTKEQEILYGVAPIKFTVCRKCMRTLVRTACAFYIWFN